MSVAIPIELLHSGLQWLKIVGLDSENAIFKKKLIASIVAFLIGMLYMAISELLLHFTIDNLADVMEGITVMLQVSKIFLTLH